MHACLVFAVEFLNWRCVSPGIHVQLEGKTEYCLEEQCRETKYMTLRALAMVDPKQQRTYGIKVQECASVYVLYTSE